MKRIGDLEIEQNLEFQEGAWRVQRIAWFAGLAILILGLLGLFGTGPISSATAGGDGPISVDYQRFVRHDGEMSLSLKVASDQVKNDQVEVWISASYLEKVELQGFSLEPDEVRSEGGRMIFVFLTGDVSEPVSITMTMRSQVFGLISGDVGIVDGSQVSVKQLSYP